MIKVNPPELNADSAVQKVRDLLPTHEVGVTLQVLAEGAYKERNFWHVDIRPSADPCSLSEVLEIMSEVEVTLQVDKGLNIMLHLIEPATNPSTGTPTEFDLDGFLLLSREEQNHIMKAAAEDAAPLYAADLAPPAAERELTAFTVLDGEPFHDDAP